jgi:hypothetical protein
LYPLEAKLSNRQETIEWDTIRTQVQDFTKSMTMQQTTITASNSVKSMAKCIRGSMSQMAVFINPVVSVMSAIKTICTMEIMNQALNTTRVMNPGQNIIKNIIMLQTITRGMSPAQNTMKVTSRELSITQDIYRELNTMRAMSLGRNIMQAMTTVLSTIMNINMERDLRRNHEINQTTACPCSITCSSFVIYLFSGIRS